MCVIYFSFQKHPRFPLILLANRDEFYARPALSVRIWEDFPQIFGGRDCLSGGTWLGITSNGKFAAVTNYREPGSSTGKSSRGDLTANFLKTDVSAEHYLNEIAESAAEYSGFNLLLGEFNEHREELFYYSNRQGEIKKLDGGIYGLSNHLLDTPWQKVEKGKRFLAEKITSNLTKGELFAVLADESPADDADLPDTGIGYEREKLLSAIFIKSPEYGTRCSSVLTVDSDFKFDFEERVFI